MAVEDETSEARKKLSQSQQPSAEGAERKRINGGESHEYEIMPDIINFMYARSHRRFI